MKKILIIDNNDSFTWNLAQLVYKVSKTRVTITNYNDIQIDEINNFEYIIISPGPETPSFYPKYKEILDKFIKRKKILGICLGHQIIFEYFGGKIYNLNKVYHGVSAELRYINPNFIFENINNPKVGLYHSWAADERTLPKELEIIAKSKNDIIMAINHKEHNIIGLQFHPESYISDCGSKIIENWLNLNIE